MRVDELIELLKECPQDAELIIQKDSEGNGYSPLCGLDEECIYVADSSYSGEIYSTILTADEADLEQEEWDELLRGKRSIVLYPIN